MLPCDSYDQQQIGSKDAELVKVCKERHKTKPSMTCFLWWGECTGIINTLAQIIQAIT